MPSLAAASNLLRLHPPLTLALRRLSIHSVASRDSGDRRTSGPDKNLLRAKTLLLKEPSHLLSSPLVGPPISSERQASLLPNQAIGFVASSQANFMRVVVEKPGPDPQNTNSDSSNLLDPRIGTDLLCVVRDLLKKIKRRVLVGDKVNDDLIMSALFHKLKWSHWLLDLVHFATKYSTNRQRYGWTFYK